MASSTILVTGAHGFIGRHVARRYAREGWRVIALGHGSWGRDEWRQWGISEWHGCDLSVDSLLTYAGEPAVVVHCAGSGSVPFSMSHPVQDYRRNVETTLSVLEFARLQAPEARIVAPSSAAVYGKAEMVPIPLLSPLLPVSPYGVHKKIAEELCQSYARSFSLRVALVRLFSVYGSGLRKQLLWDACVKISDGNTTFFGSGTETRDWVHVEDAAELLFAAREWCSSECPVENGGLGEEVSVRQVLEEILGRFGRGGELRFTGAPKSGDPERLVADASRTRALGWTPRVSWREGVREYVAWFRKGAT